MTSRPAYLSAEERRDLTVQTVIDLAALQNPAEITTTDIATRMGVTQSALFRHFPTKNAILQAVMEWVATRLMARIDRVLADAPSPMAALETAFLTHVDMVVRHPGAPRVLFGELQRADPTPARMVAQALLQQYAEKLRRLVRDGKEAGELAPDTDESAAATLFIGMIQGLTVQALISGDVRRMRADAPLTFALFRRALTAPAPAPPSGGT
ncbi:MAG: TetR family transcriptional regulator [Rubellimicrobium sp.]|nr:TetR family transcriptional regulator [Rubellimicrobium sp.]